MPPRGCERSRSCRIPAPFRRGGACPSGPRGRRPSRSSDRRCIAAPQSVRGLRRLRPCPFSSPRLSVRSFDGTAVALFNVWPSARLLREATDAGIRGHGPDPGGRFLDPFPSPEGSRGRRGQAHGATRVRGGLALRRRSDRFHRRLVDGRCPAAFPFEGRVRGRRASRNGSYRRDPAGDRNRPRGTAPRGTVRCTAASTRTVPPTARSLGSLRRGRPEIRGPGSGSGRVPTESCRRDPSSGPHRPFALRPRGPPQLRARRSGSNPSCGPRPVIFRRREQSSRPGRSPSKGARLGIATGYALTLGRSGPPEASEQAANGLAVFLMLDLLGFQDLVDLVRRELSELGVAHRPEALELSCIEPDAVAVEAHVDANAARILSIHEAATVGTDELAVRIEAEELREQFVQTGTSGEGPDLLLVEKESVAGGANVHLHRAMMGAPRLLG